MKVYISGPVSNMRNLNWEAFEDMETKLFGMHYEVENPRRNQRPLFFDLEKDHLALWQYQMKKAVKQMIDCDAVVMLDGWENSEGAKVEYWVAGLLGIRIFDEKFSQVKISPEKISLPAWDVLPYSELDDASNIFP